jgi:hypothetical protein
MQSNLLEKSKVTQLHSHLLAPKVSRDHQCSNLKVGTILRKTLALEQMNLLLSQEKNPSI